MKKWMIPVLLLMALLIVACSPTGAVEESMVEESMVEESMVEESMVEESMVEESMAEESMAEESMAEESMADESMTDHETMDQETMDQETTNEESMALPAWQTLPLVDANSGESFTLADFAGQTVFVEPMATWCTNCRRQLQNVAAARAELSGDNVRFVALSLETNLAADDLARYTRNEGFDWTFAVMSPEILQSLADGFGRSITSAPSTPHFIIRPDGSTTELTTGIDSAGELVEMIRAAGG